VSQDVQLVLWVLLILQVKHFVADFVLQTEYQYRNKGTYGHPGGLIHAAVHAAATPLAFLVIRPSFALALVIVVGEFVVHYHIDWMKEQVVRARRWDYPQAEYWWSFGADQGLHQVTYLVIAALLATRLGG
jgi:hypothetical protein